jgi:hypothetical protein
MLNNITNFFNLISTKKVKTQLDPTDLLAIGTKDPRFSGNYQPTLIEYSNFVSGLVGGSNGQVLFNDNDTISGAANFYWDKINQRVGIGTSTPAHPLDVRGVNEIIKITATGGGATIKMQNSFGSTWNVGTTGNDFYWLYNGINTFMTIKNNGNVLIDTTTDSGYKLDVNGTARVQGNATVQSLLVPTTNLYDIGTLGVRFRDGYFKGILLATEMYAEQFRFAATNYKILNVGGTQIAQWFGTGNLLIQNGGTFTDAGFRLDVNGTARVVTSILVGAGSGTGTVQTGVCRATYFNSYANNFTIFETNNSTGNAKFYQGVSVGTSSDPVASAQVEIVSTTQGFLPPRMTSAERTAILTPAVGLMVYQTDATEGLYIYKSTGWALNS